MDDAREHQAAPAPTGPSHRPPPPRPEFRVEPRHPHVDDAMPRQVTAAMWFWFASFAVLIGIVAATLIDVHDVRGALESALAGESPRTSQRDVADAVSLTLLGCGAAAAVLVVAALIVWVGDQIGVGAQLSTAVVVVLGIRIFTNAAAIRRALFHA